MRSRQYLVIDGPVLTGAWEAPPLPVVNVYADRSASFPRGAPVLYEDPCTREQAARCLKMARSCGMTVRRETL